MQRSDYAYHPLSWEQYQQIIQHGSFPNVPEPMLNRPDYDSLIAVMQPANIDPRLPLAFTWAEGHDGTDPGLVAASVNNLGGIKFSGAPGTTDSGIPADTGGTYAAFPDLSYYWREWVRIMNNSIIGPDFNSGNLIGAVEHYTNGIGTGHNKVDQFLAYVRDYPPGGVTKVVTGQDVLTEALKWEGCTDRGLYDPSNGHGTPFMWCEAFIESMHEHAGVPRVRYASALAFLNDPAIETHTTWPAPAGACILYGRNIDPAGHVTISLGDGRQIGTARDIIKIDTVWPGVAGWQWYPGVSANATPQPPAPVPDVFYVDGNPHGHIPVRVPFWARWDALNTLGTPLDHAGAINPAGLAMVTFGYPTQPEYMTATGRRIQRFERAALATSNGAAPWDVVSLLLSEIPPANTQG